MKTEVLNITPDVAKKILSNNKGNRKLNDKHVNFLTGQMLAGKWMFTADPIKISKEHRLLDGQHRLQAVVKSGKSADFLICKELEEEIFSVLDTGRIRTASDVLSTKAVSNPNESAAIAKFVILYRAGKIQHKGKVTNEEVVKFVANNPELSEIIPFIVKSYRNFRFMPASILGGIYFLLCQKNQTKADEFMELYSLGMNLTKDHPVRLLRERFIKESVSKSKIKATDKVALMIIAWNHFVSGRSLQQLKWQSDSTFPKIV